MMIDLGTIAPGGFLCDYWHHRHWLEMIPEFTLSHSAVVVKEYALGEDLIINSVRSRPAKSNEKKA